MSSGLWFFICTVAYYIMGPIINSMSRSNNMYLKLYFPCNNVIYFKHRQIGNIKKKNMMNYNEERKVLQKYIEIVFHYHWYRGFTEMGWKLHLPLFYKVPTPTPLDRKSVDIYFSRVQSMGKVGMWLGIEWKKFISELKSMNRFLRGHFFVLIYICKYCTHIGLHMCHFHSPE